jgi:hypothetical protein
MNVTLSDFLDAEKNLKAYLEPTPSSEKHMAFGSFRV